MTGDSKVAPFKVRVFTTCGRMTILTVDEIRRDPEMLCFFFEGEPVGAFTNWSQWDRPDESQLADLETMRGT